MSEDLNKLRELATKAADIAPGAWDHDTEKADGDPDYATYFMMDDKGRRLFDAHSSDVVQLFDEFSSDENGDHYDIWDENSRRLFDYLAAFNPATALSLLSRLQAAEERAEKLEGALRIISDGTVSSAPEGHYLAHRHAVKVARAALKTEGA